MRVLITNGGLASDNNIIVTDLKTLRGIINRFMRYHVKNGRWFFLSYRHFYDDSTFDLLTIIDRDDGRGKINSRMAPLYKWNYKEHVLVRDEEYNR